MKDRTFAPATEPRPAKSLPGDPKASLESSGVSVIVTVHEDVEGVEELLPALAGQTVMPDEIVFVDGGSADGTVDLLRQWRPEGTTVRVIVAAGANIAAGRNVAVQMARNDWIVSTDAGCRPAPGWVEAFAAVRGKTDLAAGIWVVDGGSPFERAVACAHYPSPDEVGSPDPFVQLSHRLFGRDFRAAEAGGRCMAFSRATWEAAGGFPEHVYAGEDRAFTATALGLGYQSVLVEDAVVHWRPRGTWWSTSRMFRIYGRGDIRTKGRTRHVARLTAWVAGPVVALRGGTFGRVVVFAAAAWYLWLPLRRARRSQLPVRHWWRIPALVAVKDISQIVGSIEGLVDTLRGVPQPSPSRSRS